MNDASDHGDPMLADPGPATPGATADQPDAAADETFGDAAGDTAEPVDAAPTGDELASEPDASAGVDVDGGAADTSPPTADLDAIARDLDGVEAALSRLDDGTYWTDEVTGAEIPDPVLAADPVARRAG